MLRPFMVWSVLEHRPQVLLRVCPSAPLRPFKVACHLCLAPVKSFDTDAFRVGLVVENMPEGLQAVVVPVQCAPWFWRRFGLICLIRRIFFGIR